MSAFLDEIRAKVDGGARLSFDDGVRLMKERDVGALGALANRVRERLHGDRTYFNVNMHLNATNVCVADCHFCSFARLQEGMPGAYTMTRRRSGGASCASRPSRHDRDPHRQRAAPGAAVRLLRGAACARIKRERPQLHLKGFTAVEIAYFAEHYGMTITEVLERLVAAGLGSLAGRRRRDLRRARAPEDLRRQGRRRRLARHPPRRAPDGAALELHDALRPHRDRRGARRPPAAPARAAGRDRRLPDLHPARVPPRQQRAREAARADGRRRPAHSSRSRG